jgi:CheY-like chemotaxis protein
LGKILKTLSDSTTILIVDDNPINLKLLDYILRQAGYTVKMEINGLNVRKQVHASIPDLIMLISGNIISSIIKSGILA